MTESPSAHKVHLRKLMPQVMMRLKNSKNLDARQSMLLDNAYFAVRPPERLGARRKQRPPEQEYMRHLVRECLTRDQVKPVRASHLSLHQAMLNTRPHRAMPKVTRAGIHGLLYA